MDPDTVLVKVPIKIKLNTEFTKENPSQDQGAFIIKIDIEHKKGWARVHSDETEHFPLGAKVHFISNKPCTLKFLNPRIFGANNNPWELPAGPLTVVATGGTDYEVWIDTKRSIDIDVLHGYEVDCLLFKPEATKGDPQIVVP